MRNGSHDASILEHEGEFIGVNLGWDFTAEHEWGIKDLTRDFGIMGTSRNKSVFNRLGVKAKDVVGVEARQVNDIPCGLSLVIKDDFTYLIYMRSWDDKYDITDETPKKELDRILSAYGDRGLVTAWDGKSFGIRVSGKENRANLKALYAAFQEGDVMIAFIGAGGPFGNNGLCLFIIPECPDFVVDGYRDADIDMLDLRDAAEATGIEKRLKDAGRRHYALTPSWAGGIKSTKDGEIKTKHPVIYWLNPIEQDKYNSGYMTVEDLEDWIEGKGKIMKDSA